MKSWPWFFAVTAIAACVEARAADDGKISLFLKCSRETPSSRERWLINGSPKQEGPSKVCADRGHSVTNIYVEAIDLKEAPSLGEYALFVSVDKKRSDELNSFSSASIGKTLVMEKGGRFIDVGFVSAPMRNAVIFIGVPDKKTGEQLGNVIFGAPGKMSK